MRLLHTSDWHLGRGLHGQSLLGAQAMFLDHLVEVVQAQSVDLVVIAGDVYDRALPGVEAVALLDEGLDRLLAAGAQILLSAGNHDSAQRLGFGRRRSARAGLHVRTGLADASEPLLLHDRHGEIACYAIGYLEPGLAAAELGVSRSHEAVLGQVMRQVRADLVGRGRPRSVVAAHAFIAGGHPTDSERDIRVGGVDRAPVTIFDGIDYVALGHLHRPQVLHPQARYCGSPVAYSFSEAGQAKGSWLVDLDAGGFAHARFVEAPVHTPLARLRGTVADLLADPALADAESAYCHVVLTDVERPRSPMERLRARFPLTLALSFEPAGVTATPTAPAARVGLDDEALCAAFFDHVRGHRLSPEERRVVQQALEAGRLAEATA